MTDTNDPPSSDVHVPQWGTSTRLIVTVGLLIGLVYALTLLAPVIQMLIIAFILAFLMSIPSQALAERTPIPYTVVVVFLYILLITLVILLILTFIPSFLDGVQGLFEDAQVAYANVQTALQEYEPENGFVYIFNFEIDLNPIIQPMRDFILGTSGEEGSTPIPGIETIDLQQLVQSLFSVAGTITGTLTSAFTSITGLLSTILLSVFISFLIVVDVPNNRISVYNWIPESYHREYAILMERIENIWKGFFRGQVTIGFIIGLLTWLQLSIMGVSSAAILAVTVGIISLIPTVGGFIALIPLFFIPLIQGSSVFVDMSSGLFALLVVAGNLIISQVIWNAIAPKILGDILDLPLPVIIVGVFIGAAVGGILGAFLVAPIMGTIRVIVVYLLNKLGRIDPFPGLDPPPDSAIYHIAEARKKREQQANG